MKYLLLFVILLFGVNVFADDFSNAIAKAKQEDKYVFVLFTTETCVPCYQLKSTTLQDKKVQWDLDHYIKLELDGDKNLNVLRGISAKLQNFRPAYPAYFLINPHTNKPDRYGIGYKDATSFRKWIRGD